MIEKIIIAAFVLILFAATGYVLFVTPMRVASAMTVLKSSGYAEGDVQDTTTSANMHWLLPLPNDRVFIASEKTQGPTAFKNVWVSESKMNYFAYLTRWQRMPNFTAEQGARRNEQLQQTCYFERSPHRDQSTLFIGYNVESRGIVDLETYHGVTQVHDGFDPEFIKGFSVFAPVGTTAQLRFSMQTVLMKHAEYIKNTPYASLKFSASGWGFCRYRITDAKELQTFKEVCDDISKVFY